MVVKKPQKKVDFSLVLSLMILLIINVLSGRNNLFFHFVAEVYTIIISCCLFAITWILRDRIDNGYFTIPGIGLLFASLFDLMHILTFEGMPIFPEMNLNHSFYFLLTARFLQATTFALAPICVNHKTKSNLALLLYGFFSILVAFLILSQNLSPLFTPDGNHSPTGNVIEVSVTTIFVFAWIHVYLKRSNFDKGVFAVIISAIMLAIGSEIVIAFNSPENHLVSILGLNLKILSYFLIFQTILVTGIAKPQRVFYRELQTSWEQLRNLISNLNEGVGIIGLQGNFIFSNPAADKIFGVKPGQLINHYLSEFLPDDQQTEFIKNKKIQINGFPVLTN